MGTPRRRRFGRLTAQELEILNLAITGHGLEEIAQRLRVSVLQAKTLLDECIEKVIRGRPPESDAPGASESAERAPGTGEKQAPTDEAE